MVTVARLLAVAILTIVAGANPAFGWWRYAQWSMSEERIVSAGRGQAVPCRAEVPVCSSALEVALASRVI